MRFNSYAWWLAVVLLSSKCSQADPQNSSPSTPLAVCPLRSTDYDFGSCSNPGIQYGPNINNANRYGYAPADQNQFPQAWSSDVASVESYICSRLRSSYCDADDDAIAACQSAFWLYSGLSGQLAVYAWNNALGLSSTCLPTITITKTRSAIDSASSFSSTSTTTLGTTSTSTHGSVSAARSTSISATSSSEVLVFTVSKTSSSTFTSKASSSSSSTSISPSLSTRVITATVSASSGTGLSASRITSVVVVTASPANASPSPISTGLSGGGSPFDKTGQNDGGEVVKFTGRSDWVIMVVVVLFVELILL